MDDCTIRSTQSISAFNTLPTVESPPQKSDSYNALQPNCQFNVASGTYLAESNTTTAGADRSSPVIDMVSSQQNKKTSFSDKVRNFFSTLINFFKRETAPKDCHCTELTEEESKHQHIKAFCKFNEIAASCIEMMQKIPNTSNASQDTCNDDMTSEWAMVEATPQSILSSIIQGVYDAAKECNIELKKGCVESLPSVAENLNMGDNINKNDMKNIVKDITKTLLSPVLFNKTIDYSKNFNIKWDTTTADEFLNNQTNAFIEYLSAIHMNEGKKLNSESAPKMFEEEKDLEEQSLEKKQQNNAGLATSIDVDGNTFYFFKQIQDDLTRDHYYLNNEQIEVATEPDGKDNVTGQDKTTVSVKNTMKTLIRQIIKATQNPDGTENIEKAQKTLKAISIFANQQLQADICGYTLTALQGAYTYAMGTGQASNYRISIEQDGSVKMLFDRKIIFDDEKGTALPFTGTLENSVELIIPAKLIEDIDNPDIAQKMQSAQESDKKDYQLSINTKDTPNVVNADFKFKSDFIVSNSADAA